VAILCKSVVTAHLSTVLLRALDAHETRFRATSWRLRVTTDLIAFVHEGKGFASRGSRFDPGPLHLVTRTPPKFLVGGIFVLRIVSYPPAMS
jgi:hypothetical protein